MLKILIDNTEVDFLPDISIQLTYTNPMFSDKKINEVESYNFTLPATPKINNIYLNSNTVNSTQKQVKKKIKIYHSGILFITGVVHIEKKGSTAYSCYVQNEGTDFYKETTELSLLEVDFGSVELWTEAEDATLTAAEKIGKWADHMESINGAGPTATDYKFPMIKAYYDPIDADGLDLQVNGNNYVFWRAGIINGYLKGDFIRNSVVPKNTYDNDKNWHHTISPCLRAQYTLEKILDLYNIHLEENELEKITEYAQLLFFSRKVKDEYLDLGTDTANVHGRKFELNDFVPDVSVWELFEFINEIFGAYFIISSNEIFIRQYNSSINSKAIDFTRFANPQENLSDSDSVKYNISYDLTKAEIDQYNFSNVAFGNLDQWQFNAYDQGGIKQEPIIFKHLPLTSIYSMDFGFVQNYNQFFQYWPGNREYVPMCTLVPYGTEVSEENTLIVLSDEFPESGLRADKFLALLFRGYHPTIRFDFDANTGAYDPNSPIQTDTYFPCNLENTERFLDFPNPPLSPIYFSDKHIYLTEAEPGEERGVFNSYHKQLYDLINGAREVEKELYLPTHKVKELSKFRDPKHTIDNPRGRFSGYVKQFKCTLYANSISSTTITYLFQV